MRKRKAFPNLPPPPSNPNLPPPPSNPKLPPTPSKIVWAIREVVQYIYEWAKPHHTETLLNKAKAQISERYWEPLRQKLIGPDTVDVCALLEKYIAYRRRYHTSKVKLYSLEERAGLPHLASYTLEECLTRLDDKFYLSFPHKLLISDATHFRINAEMNKKITFIKLKRAIGVGGCNDRLYLDYVDANSDFFCVYDKYGDFDPDEHFIPCFCYLRDRVCDLLGAQERVYWAHGDGRMILDFLGL